MSRPRALACLTLICFFACAGEDPAPLLSPERPGTRAAPPARLDVGLGVVVDSSTPSGAPRLVRALALRPSPAGMTPAQAARAHLGALAPLYVAGGAAAPLVERGTQVLRNGASIVRLEQNVDGAVVDGGEVRVLLHPDRSLAAVAGTLVAAATAPTFVSTPSQVVERALDQVYGAARPRPAIAEAGATGGWAAVEVAASPALRVRQVRARRTLVGQDGALVPAWTVEILGAPVGEADRGRRPASITARRLLVADGGGRVLRDVDLLHRDSYTYRVHAEAGGDRRPTDGIVESFAPHPTGNPDEALPGLETSSLVVMEAFNRPGDPWLPAGATTTSGNNAVAFADFDDSWSFDEGDVRPDVGAGGVFDSTYDPTVEPRATADQARASAVNAFYVTNWMHDWWYDSGFTEAAGNAQEDNFGRGGLGGDPIRVLVQYGDDDAVREGGGAAVFFDGDFHVVMAMSLWRDATDSALDSPTGELASATFIAQPHTFEVTGQVVTADDGSPPSNDGCEPLRNDVAGKIPIFVFTGDCGSTSIVENARAHGAIAVILFDASRNVPISYDGNRTAALPGLAIGRDDGVALRAAASSRSVTVTLRSHSKGPERDGGLDNTLIAHEFAHLLHLRLTQCDLGAQCSAMGEGWGDFNALLMMVREGDDTSGTFAIAPYATADGTYDASYFGIRRFPYSVDRAKNGLSFRHIGRGEPLPPGPVGPFPGTLENHEIHNAGEVWATMLWEALSTLIDAHGVDAARRRMSDYVVAGLQLTPPEASFTEARDALLTAAGAIDDEDMLLMAAAFASRGLGSCAVAPSPIRDDFSDVVESTSLSARVVAGDVGLVDDRTSCDADGYLDPGESGFLRVTVTNVGFIAAENVTARATTQSPGVAIGAPVAIASLERLASREILIPVTLSQSAPVGRTITVDLVITRDQDCDPAPIHLRVERRTGFDEVPASATVDRFETVFTPWTAAVDTGIEGDTTGIWAPRQDGDNRFWFVPDGEFFADATLVSPLLQVSTTEPFVVRFAHAHAFSLLFGAFLDGGVIELSSDGGASFRDVTELGVEPGYNGVLNPFPDNPLYLRRGFVDQSQDYPALVPVVLDFGTRLAGQAVKLRFRFATDGGVGDGGWRIDDVAASGIVNVPFPTLAPEPTICRRP